MKLTDPVIREKPDLAVDYLAFDSLGTMSMCVRAETPDLTVTIDPGVSVEPDSFPLPRPRREELQRRQLAAVRASCATSGYIVVTHYHLDHLMVERSAELYGGKTVFCRDPKVVPARQAETGTRFLRALDGLAREVIFCDGREFKVGKSRITFSPPAWHGAEGAEPGTVVMTSVSRGKEKVLVSSDVGGPLEKATTDYICESKARILVLDGYPSYRLGQFATDFDLVRSITNICRILSSRDLKTLVLDHHSARDYRYPAFLKLAYARAQAKKKAFGTAAEVMGKRSLVLEGYQDYGPTKWQKWAPLEAPDARKVLERAAAEGKLEADWIAAFDRWVA
jgi:predicted metallo-beta-lactamase superfamily hydrolase